jgi:ribonuclease Z
MKLHLLGTGAAVSDPHRTTTMLAVEHDHRLLLVDCGGDVIPRMVAMGLDPVSMDALIVTHEHADHVSGFPLLMERLWLMGRKAPLKVLGIAPAIAQVRRVHDAFDTSSWAGYPGFTTHEIPYEEGAPVWGDEGLTVTAAPGTHAVPTVGLRFEDRAGRVLAYSCDTRPCDAITRLAAGAHVLVHEATGEGPAHSSAAQAAGVAEAAGAERLILVHVPPERVRAADVQAAQARFGRTEVGSERTTYDV